MCDRAIEPADGGFVGQIDARMEGQAGMVAMREMQRFLLDEIGNMAGRARLQQGANHRGAQRSGPAGDDHGAILEFHLVSLSFAIAEPYPFYRLLVLGLGFHNRDAGVLTSLLRLRG